MRKGEPQQMCKRKLHLMHFFNTWIRPSDNARYCKDCMRARRKFYRDTPNAVPPGRYKDDRLYNDSTGERILWTDLFPLSLAQIFDKMAQKSLGMSGEEFLTRWDNNEWPNPSEVPKVMDVAQFICLVRKNNSK